MADYAAPMIEALSYVGEVPNGIRAGRASPKASGLTTKDHVARLSIRHPDERLDYLSRAGLSDDEVTRSADIVERWLNTVRSSLEEVARNAFEAGEGLDWIMAAWSETGPYASLDVLIQESSVSHPELLLCYSVCSATELALSMLMLLQLDGVAEPVLGGSDAEWAAEDQRIASLGLVEEASNWPV